MLKRIFKYTDFNGEERKEEAYFHLSQSELTAMEVANNGLEYTINQIVKTADGKKLIEIFQDLILKSYGEKSPDGRRFIKSKELSESFSQTPAYDELFMELAMDADKAAEFINAITPTIKEQPPKHPAV